MRFLYQNVEILFVLEDLMKMVSVHIELCTFAIISQKMICQKFHLNELVYARGYALIMENNQSIQIAQGYVVHLFREEMLLFIQRESMRILA